MFKRKIVAASVTASLYAFILSIIMPNPFKVNVDYIFPSILKITEIFPVYLMYSLPVILVYGILTSLLSDKLASLYAQYITVKLESLISFVLHLLFGLILLHISLIAAVLFFTIDKWMQYRAFAISWKTALLSLLLPVTLFILPVTIMNLLHSGN